MDQYANSLWRATLWTKCSCVAPCRSEISHFLRTENGSPWLASKCRPIPEEKLYTQFNSSELVVKVVNTTDMTRVLYLRDQPKPVKHVSFDCSGTHLAVSCTDGILYMYSLSSEEPQLVKKVDGLIRTLEAEDQGSSKIAWHPDGRAFAAATATRGLFWEVSPIGRG